MTKILFQGDSITDASRVRTDPESAGCGYAQMVKGELGLESPGEYEFVNRGVAGERVVNIYARIVLDIILVKPDVMSILVGVNDVWTEADKFYKVYNLLIEEIKEDLPDVKIIIMEPFVLPGSIPEKHGWEFYRSEVETRAKLARKIAEKYDLPFIPLQADFDALAEKTKPSDWLSDGVHPTAMGHTFIRNKWIEAFKKL